MAPAGFAGRLTKAGASATAAMILCRRRNVAPFLVGPSMNAQETGSMDYQLGADHAHLLPLLPRVRLSPQRDEPEYSRAEAILSKRKCFVHTSR